MLISNFETFTMGCRIALKSFSCELSSLSWIGSVYLYTCLYHYCWHEHSHTHLFCKTEKYLGFERVYLPEKLGCIFVMLLDYKVRNLWCSYYYFKYNLCRDLWNFDVWPQDGNLECLSVSDSLILTRWYWADHLTPCSQCESCINRS